MPELFLQRILYLVFFALGWLATNWMNRWSDDRPGQILRRGTSRILIVVAGAFFVLVVAFQTQNGSMETPEWYLWMLFGVPFAALGAAGRTLAHSAVELRKFLSLDI
jgi:hypothetical protein